MAFQEKPRDFVKSVLDFPKKLLLILNIYPEKLNRFTNIAFWIMISCVSFMEYGQTYYMICNITDLAVMASTCTTVSTNFQAICKLIILYKNLQNLKTLLKTVDTEFWPASLADTKLKKSLRNQANIARFNMYGLYCIAITFATEFISLSIISKEKTLPFASKFPFDWTVSPAYEILFIFQVITNVCIIITSICGHDFLFIALVINIISQFRLLKFAFKAIGNKNCQKVYDAVKDITKEEEDIFDKHEKDIDVKLLRKCIQHHIKLLKCCDDLEMIFSITVFAQYVSSTSAICVSSFLITEIKKTTISHLVSYCVGHVFQLFLYCVMGNEITFQTTEIANAIFESNWYMTDSKKVDRNMILIIQRAQKGKKITALKLTDLNFVSFLKVLRLSFSFHTLLHTIQDK